MSKNLFCSDLTRQSGEPLAGTAPFANHFIFISWPKQLWTYEALESKGGFPQALKTWSKSSSNPRQKITVRLASHVGTTSQKVSIFFYPEARMLRGVEAKAIPELLNQWLTKRTREKLNWVPIEMPQLFICTHGRHDKCCAKYGQSVYRKFRDETRARNLALDVWEASHLGGHRFAANLMLFPQGHFHGHLDQNTVSAFLDAWELDQIYAPTYRGHSFKEGIAQVADAHLVQYCTLQGWNAELHLDDLKKNTDAEFFCTIKLKPKTGRSYLMRDQAPKMPDRLEVRFRSMEFQNAGACDALDDIKNRESWRIESVKPLE